MAQVQKISRSKKVTKKVTSKVTSKSKQEFGGFVEFIRVQGVVGLAIGFVIGTQAKVLVDQFTASFVSPILGIFAGNGRGLADQDLEVIVNGTKMNFAWGGFAFALINFLIMMGIIYFTFKWLKLDKLDKPKG